MVCGWGREGASYLQRHTVAPRHAGQGVFSVVVVVVGRRGRGVRDVALGAGERAPGLARPGGLGGARGLLLLGFFVGAFEVEEVVDLGWALVSLGGDGGEGEGEVDGGALGEGGGGGVCGIGCPSPRSAGAGVGWSPRGSRVPGDRSTFSAPA